MTDGQTAILLLLSASCGAGFVGCALWDAVSWLLWKRKRRKWQVILNTNDVNFHGFEKPE